MNAPAMTPGMVTPVTRRIDIAGSPLDVYRALTDGCRQDTCFVRFDGSPPFACVRSAARVVCRGRRVEVNALTPNGRGVVAHLADQLVDAPQLHVAADRLFVEYPSPTFCSGESERMFAPSPVDVLRALSRLELTVRPSKRPVVFPGTFGYDLVEQFEDLPDVPKMHAGPPDFVFEVPERLVTFDEATGAARVSVLVYGGMHAAATMHDARGAIKTMVDACRPGPSPPPLVTAVAGEPTVDIDDDRFAALVGRARRHIDAGDVFQLVLSRTFRTPCPRPLEAFRRLRRTNPSPFEFFFSFDEDVLFGTSPETAVRVTDRLVSVRPIAGTRRRARLPDGTVDADLDARLEADLRLDDKELAEHMMLVDLARNDVARVAKPGTRRVSRLLGVDRYSAVMHLVSHVDGELRADLDALHAYVASMNMGTLTGAPKVRASQLIRRYEAERRGFYGGAAGFLTPDGDLDTAIVIRSAHVRAGVAHVRAGAGIVHDSVPDHEADETRRKAQAVLDALGAGGMR